MEMRWIAIGLAMVVVIMGLKCLLEMRLKEKAKDELQALLARHGLALAILSELLHWVDEQDQIEEQKQE